MGGNEGNGGEGSGPKEALERDWEQTKNDVPGLEGEDLDQDVDDTVKQAAGGDSDEGSQNQ